ncbi:retrotransposon protein, putative, ty1-copia subclass [Tanacetum coccineum]
MDYYFYYPPENKIVVERYVDFLENDFILQKKSGRNVELDDEDILPSENTSEHPIEEEKIGPDRLCFNVEVEEHSLGDLNKPANYKAALLDPEFEKWLVAMNAEMKSMFDNVYIYKARLVAKGVTQTYGVDMRKTFPPVAGHKVLLEFLIAMRAKVCKLQRSIYGLKQASRSWNKRFDEEIKKFGFHQNLDEPCVYQKASGSNVIFLILYVDDIILMGYHIPSLQEVKDYLEMKNPSEAHWTVGKNILKYLRNTKDTFLVYGGNPEAELQVKCYCDAGFETDRDDTKSQTGYVFVLNGGAVVWKSSKQSTTAQHATEAEYIAAKEAVWIRKFIDELGVVPSNDYPIKMNCDNSAAIIIAKELGIQKAPDTSMKISLC